MKEEKTNEKSIVTTKMNTRYKSRAVMELRFHGGLFFYKKIKIILVIKYVHF